MVFRETDKKILEEHFGKEDAPQTPNEADTRLRNAETLGKSFPASVYLALQNLFCSGMGKKDNPKKKDRKFGKKLRKKRTGSRKG